MLIFRTIGKLFLGFWLLVGVTFAVGRLVFVEDVGGGRSKAIDYAEAATGEDLSHYRRKNAAADDTGTVAEQWEAERQEAEAEARHERRY
jgi:hypothetical protein